VAFFLCLHFFLRFWLIDSGVYNYGGPFGVILPELIFILLLLGATVFLVVQWWREESFLLEWFWLFILAGGLGNLSERFFFGSIVDYVALSFFPVFNFSDILLTIGVLGIIIQWAKNTVKNQESGIRNQDF
jgi:signal peptidase II